MPDDLTKRGPEDRSRINVSEDHELAYWTKELGVTREKLIETVMQTGPSVEAVRAALGKAAR